MLQSGTSDISVVVRYRHR